MVPISWKNGINKTINVDMIGDNNIKKIELMLLKYINSVFTRYKVTIAGIVNVII